MNSFKFLMIISGLISLKGIGQVNSEAKFTKRNTYLSDNPKKNAMDSVVETAVTDFIQSPQSCGLSIGVIKDGNFFFYNYGETKRDNKTLPNNNTIFEIGSITKTFCGLLLAQAVTEGKIKLDDDIRKYLPGKYPNLETRKKVIEVKHLANHTSGLPRIPENITLQPAFDSLNPYKNYDKKMMLDYLKTCTLSQEPGQIGEYSNYGMALLGIIIEQVYNKSFEQLVKQKICSPANMTSTGINLSDEQALRFADGFTRDGITTPHWELGGFVAAGGLKSTALDMLNYLDYNMTENDGATKLSHQSTINNGTNVALAWNIITTKFSNQLIWHNGATFGFSSFCGFIKEKKAALVILSNASINVDYIGLSVLKYLQK